MIYDLNVPWSPTQTPAELERTISFLSSLGYDTLALNHSITTVPSIPSNPIPLNHPFALPSKTTILRRCTITISDPSLNHRLPQLAPLYDILAVRPTNEKAFLSACQSLSDHSVISLDLTQRYQFHFKYKPLMTAINRGIRFEICYAEATMGDSTAKRNFISNVMGIVRATKGRGFIISSGASSVLGVRPPADIINLLDVWGLGRERSVEAFGVNARAVVVNEGVKRSSYRGVIDVIYGGEKPVMPESAKDQATKGKQQKGKGKAQYLNEGKEQEVKGGNGNETNEEGTLQGKRKAEDTSVESTPVISKRQAKRMKLAALKAEKDVSSAPSNTSEVTTPEPSEPASTIKSTADG